MKEDNKINPRNTQSDLSKSSEKGQDNASGVNFKQNEWEAGSVEKRLEDKPGAYLLKDISVDEESSSIENKVKRPPEPDEEVTSEDEDFDEAGDDLFNDDELGLDTFGDYDDEYD